MPSYTSYKSQLKAVLDANNDNIEAWITVKGNHIPIMKGQSKEEAVKSFLEKKGGESGGKKQTFYKNVSGKQIFNKPGISSAKKGYTVVENQLLTEKEMKKHGFDPNSKGFEKVELGKNEHRYEMGARRDVRKKDESTKESNAPKTIRGKTNFGNRMGKIFSTIGAVGNPKSVVINCNEEDAKFGWNDIGKAIEYAKSVDDVTGISIYGQDGKKLGWFGIEPMNADGDIFDIVYDYTDNDFCNKVMAKLEGKEWSPENSDEDNKLKEKIKNEHEELMSKIKKENQPASIEETEEAIENWASEAYEKHQANSISKEYNLLKKQVKNIESVLNENRRQQSAIPAGAATFSNLNKLRKEEDRLIKQLRDAQQELDEFVHYEMN